MTEDRMDALAEKLKPGFPLLSDPGNAYARSLDLVFAVEPAVRDVATIDLVPGVDATRVIAELRRNGIVDVDPYRALKRNQLQIGTYASVTTDRKSVV